MSDRTLDPDRTDVSAPPEAAAPYGERRPRGPTPFWFVPAFRKPAVLHTRYEDQLTLFQTRFGRVGVAALLAILAVAPFMLTDFWLSVLNFAAVTTIAALGLNLLTGFTGQVSLGHAFFLGLGAYTAGYLGGDLGLPVVVWLPASGLLAALVGLVIGPFALRLRGLYLAIVTIGLVFLGEHLFLNADALTGGPQGRSIPDPAVGGLDFSALGGLSRQQSFYILAVPLAALATLFAKNVVRSRPGRAFQAIRDREIAAAVLGVNLARYKVGAFALSSFYAGAAGALLGSLISYVVPSQFDLLLSIKYVAVIIVGGVGTVSGAILGALFIELIPPLVEQVSPSLPFVAANARESGINVLVLNQIIFGTLILTFLIAEPHGLAGIWMRIKVYFRSWPFSY